MNKSEETNTEILSKERLQAMFDELDTRVQNQVRAVAVEGRTSVLGVVAAMVVRGQQEAERQANQELYASVPKFSMVH